MEEKPPWELEALTYLGKKMEEEEDEGDFGFEVWEVEEVLVLDPKWGYLKSWKVRARMGCERTRLPFKIGQKSQNWCPGRCTYSPFVQRPYSATSLE